MLPISNMEGTDPVTERIIGCAIEVHRDLGAGLLESAYLNALYVELALRLAFVADYYSTSTRRF